MIKKIAILTSGGDSPGMNAAIRSLVRYGIGNNFKMYGIERGYSGLLNKEIHELTASSVGNILQRGGTFLKTSRSKDFLLKENREKAYAHLKDLGIDALVVIGGDGSFRGAKTISEEFSIPVIGIPATIDNDILGTEYTIGFETAVQTAIDAVDKIRDTAISSDRTFLIEVMGARSSSIALKVGICTGAENILLFNDPIDYEKISSDIKRGMKRGKLSSIIIVAEGEKPGRSYDIANILEDMHHISSKVCILGHIQRGGSPMAHDRFIASLMGKTAIDTLMKGEKARAIVVRGDKVIDVPLEECFGKSDSNYIHLKGIAETLSI